MGLAGVRRCGGCFDGLRGAVAAAPVQPGHWIRGHFVMALGVVIPLAVPGLPGIVIAALLVGSTFVVVTM